MNKILPPLCEKLNEHGFISMCFETKEDLIKQIDAIVPETSEIGMGGCQSATDIGLLDHLQSRKCIIHSHSFSNGKLKEEVRKNAASSDFYITSAGAITTQGQLINIDGVCNRISSICYGPKSVIFIVGINKIVANYDQGITRIKRTACPKNAERLNLNTPCRTTLLCHDCNSPDRMCRGTLILDRPPRDKTCYVFFLDQPLGY